MRATADMLAVVTASALERERQSTMRAAVTARLAEWRAQGLGRFEHAAAWALDVARIVIEATTQERPGWLLRDRVDPAVVLATRRQIQRYARDMSVNMAVILDLLLVFFLSIAAGVSR